MIKTRPAVSLATRLAPLQALSDENRLRIIEVLRSGEHCVCDLQSSLDMGQSLLSHHLKALREAGLVLSRKEGRWVHYSLATDVLWELEAYFAAVRRDADIAPARPSKC
jgi:ArsR family transcriptional regulator, arsenate/arsenite/antimonite-responsive transcriptional repressor